MALTRRELLEVATLTMAALGAGRSWATPWQLLDRADNSDFYHFPALGQVTLLHFTDCHAQLLPVYTRESQTRLHHDPHHRLPPYLTGQAFLDHFAIDSGSLAAHLCTPVNFVAMAQEIGPVGGMAHMATMIRRTRAERGHDNVLLLDGGDTWQGSYTSMLMAGDDMIQICNRLGVEAMTAHWEFTYGASRLLENVGKLHGKLLAHNVGDSEREEPIFNDYHLFEKGGNRIAVIGQAFPHTTVAHPRRVIPKWSIGLRQANLQQTVESARSEGAHLVVLLSHNGLEVDLELAAHLVGIDIILGGHSHDVLPQPMVVANAGGRTLVCNAGSNGKFLGRIDLDVRKGRLVEWRYQLMPVLPRFVPAAPDIAHLIHALREPHEAMLGQELGQSETELYRRDNFNSSFDDLIGLALCEELESELAIFPGFRWGTALLPGQMISREAIYNQTAISYPYVYRRQLNGAQIKDLLEAAADSLFNKDPYRHQGNDMLRATGLRYAIQPSAAMGRRIRDLELNGRALDPKKVYTVAEWAILGDERMGQPVWDIVARYVARHTPIRLRPMPVIKQFL
ncbi:MAG: thiosulfohydrolase SoxB [Magnetococcales bacterium]|nr:thiosulfohydrolase SoxB [Magnetococcales bacterium]